METKIFTGKDKTDLDQQIWNWRQANPKFILKETHPIETLPLEIAPSAPPTKVMPPDMVLIRVEYEAAN
jgi:hypothetical protein